MIMRTYQDKVIYSDNQGQVEIGYIHKAKNGTIYFIMTSREIALEATDLVHIGKMVKDGI